jgi:hypothetical protein
MKMTAGLSGISDTDFNEGWLNSLLTVQPKFKHLGMDVVQYEAEKLLWDCNCKNFLFDLKFRFWVLNNMLISIFRSGLKTGGPFEGKDPRTRLGYVRHSAAVGLEQSRVESGDTTADV